MTVEQVAVKRLTVEQAVVRQQIDHILLISELTVSEQVEVLERLLANLQFQMKPSITKP